MQQVALVVVTRLADWGAAGGGGGGGGLVGRWWEAVSTGLRHGRTGGVGGRSDRRHRRLTLSERDLDPAWWRRICIQDGHVLRHAAGKGWIHSWWNSCHGSVVLLHCRHAAGEELPGHLLLLRRKLLEIGDRADVDLMPAQVGHLGRFLQDRQRIGRKRLPLSPAELRKEGLLVLGQAGRPAGRITGHADHAAGGQREVHIRSPCELLHRHRRLQGLLTHGVSRIR